MRRGCRPRRSADRSRLRIICPVCRTSAEPCAPAGLLTPAPLTTWNAPGCQPENPAWGRCDIAALIDKDVFGGDLMAGEVHLIGVQHGFHIRNRLAIGIELDLTRARVQRGQTVAEGGVVERPPEPLRRWGEYLLLLRRDHRTPRLPAGAFCVSSAAGSARLIQRNDALAADVLSQS
ncbi:YunG family protein [[Kitasatospora] papulosa]